MAEGDLAEFLAAQEAAGSSAGEGEFTLSHDEAARKLAKFSLPRQYAWVSKLVQAAVVWCCSEFTVTQSPTQTRFRFPLGPEQVPTEEELLSNLLSPKIGCLQALDHLCQALRAMVQQTELSFLLVLDDGQTEPRTLYAGVYFSSVSEAGRLHPRYSGGLGITLTVDHIESSRPRRGLSRMAVQMHGFPIVAELNSRAYLCPIPLTVDGRRADGVFSSAHAWRNTLRPLYLSGVTVPWLGLPSMPVPVGFQERVFNVFTEHHEMSREPSRHSEFTAAFLVSVKLQKQLGVFQERERPQGFLHWVVDGVVVQTEYLPVPTDILVLNVFLNAQGLKTDLTGLQLVDDIDLDYRKEEVLAAIGRYLGQTTVPDFFVAEATPPDLKAIQERVQEARVKRILQGTGIGLALSLWTPPLGIGIALISALAGKLSPVQDHRYEQIKEHADALRGRFQSDWDHLARELTRHEAQNS